ncbi:hypothetical protein EVG20_g4134 [Dentipellis fragilis]|uniref:Glutathione S-transferase UstS-like C-terminal domain-containing protein n=1 Tax=Dentipellis fragilis TaxID=205917 RepID=A0A4Y9YX34_9AGAM|nr:hypothetical protein EVG20_g4134 [Dentipellis fragilis]
MTFRRLYLAHRGIRILGKPDWRLMRRAFSIALSGSNTQTLQASASASNPNTGAVVSDSSKIAKYLDEKYPDTIRLLPNGTEAFQAMFISVLGEKVAFAILKTFIGSGVSLLNSPSREYFRRTREKKFGMRLEEIAPEGPARDQAWKEALEGLSLISTWEAAGENAFMMGDTPSFADIALLSQLQWIKTMGGAESKEWKDVMVADGGRWASFYQALERWTSVDEGSFVEVNNVDSLELGERANGGISAKGLAEFSVDAGPPRWLSTRVTLARAYIAVSSPLESPGSRLSLFFSVMFRATPLWQQSFEHSLKSLDRFRDTLSGLKRTRPHVPFWKLAAHRVPTLWSLYRGLLRSSPDEQVKWRIGALFRFHRKITSPQKAKEKLEHFNRWLVLFRQAQAGDEHLQAVLRRYGTMIAERRDKEKFKDILRAEAKWQERLRNRPILKGSYFRPSTSNPPLPRMSPQPIQISMMITKRRLSRIRRVATSREINRNIAYIDEEALFEERLAEANPGARFRPLFSGRNKAEWREPVIEQVKDLNQTFRRDEERAKKPFPPALIAQVEAARKERDRNIAREREREKRGEVLKATKIRRGLGYPPPAWQKWSRKKRREMLIVRRSISRVGYVGFLKRKMGWKIGPPEDSYSGEKLARLKRLEKQLEEEQRKRWEDEERMLSEEIVPQKVSTNEDKS